LKYQIIDKALENALIIFVKNAEKGKVKTRLASTLGDEKALKIYLALLDHTRKIAQKVDANRLLFYSNNIQKNDDWPLTDFDKLNQEGNNLGDRMTHAFHTAFQQYHKVVIIGSDCASLTTKIIQNAFDHLAQHDFVIGPAMDGGYYLLGMRTFHPSLFQDIEWSTEKVLSATIQKINALQKTYTLLPELSDIDYEEDWEKYGWEI